jgi:hypothetical protein
MLLKFITLQTNCINRNSICSLCLLQTSVSPGTTDRRTNNLSYEQFFEDEDGQSKFENICKCVGFLDKSSLILKLTKYDPNKNKLES